MPARQSSNQRAVARRAILLLEGASAQCSSMQTRCPRDLSCHADAAPRREAPMTDYTYDFVNVRVGDGIAWAALNRPEKRNAMSPALHYEMDDALARLQGRCRCGAAAPRALLRLPRRAVRRQGGRAHRHDQLCGSSREARGCDH